jgi:surface protein
MAGMFQQCSSITTLNLSSFDTKIVTSMFRMFYYCNNLRTVYVSDNFVTTALTNDNVMSGNNVIGTNSSNLFNGCSKLVGGAGTTYTSSNPTDKTYARIDYIDTEHPENSKPGYFTRKPTI